MTYLLAKLSLAPRRAYVKWNQSVEGARKYWTGQGAFQPANRPIRNHLRSISHFGRNGRLKAAEQPALKPLGLFGALRALDDRQRLRIGCQLGLQDALIELQPHHCQADQLILIQLVNQPRCDWVAMWPRPELKQLRNIFFWHSDLSFSGLCGLPFRAS